MIGLIGSGKTGSHVKKLSENLDWKVFNSKNRPDYDSLMQCEAVIVFLPGSVLDQYLPLLVETGVPIICGTTGFEYPEDFADQVRQRNQVWIHANNFSPAMSVVRNLIKLLGNSEKILQGFKPSILERHHIHKQDSPSGTALHWQEWLGKDCLIQAEREGDVVGFHQLNFDSELETIQITHQAKNRSLFAKGALLALQWVQQGLISPGFSKFETLIDKELECD